VARKSDDGRWDSKFAQFVQAYGVEKLAARTGVRPMSVYHWISGRTGPRRETAKIIVKIAGRGKLSMEEIYR